ncbi:sigma 54-interacting transcriptional regulator [Rubellicoccus peritrichatus]|uniref:Sigma 54-interacting transcriptional regulator n=1 Tax=Rubellicoccus peritrichatus TaxID=3080537 RepID=A0AAQ3L631_9BACT|nr:sigma 54-interacting transcriptional regulator [Puniceicoccus sp. CR14]WOO39591.1 sigma 54-interacting transcriptional regulator [Puniceicoccus sp. CR14]
MAAGKIFSEKDSKLALDVVQLVWANPFSGERIEIERRLLGLGSGSRLSMEEFSRLLELPAQLLDRGRRRLAEAGGKSASDFDIYQQIAFFELFHQFAPDFDRLINDAHERGSAGRRITFYDRFEKLLDYWVPAGLGGEYQGFPASRLFAVYFQVRRAYYHIVHYIVGESDAARQLRSRVWQSIFTHDMERYQRVLTERLGDVITLITGPSGSGKELVARGIGLSRFIPFDATNRQFEEDFVRAFYPVNLSALSTNLIESELFGHRKGAFTGALKDRKGYLETCGPYGTVFLDEIGETEVAIQVKLLRLLQTRVFSPIGDTESLHFRGKIMAATNRDLAEEIDSGRFREDFYFRLNADRIHTPSLKDILANNASELERLVGFIARRVAGPEGSSLTAEVCDFIRKEMPAEYPWPGNFRELEQCVRNVLIHGDYTAEEFHSKRKVPEWQRRFEQGEFTADELLSEYVTRLYKETPNYEALGRRLDLDRRTVKKYVKADS